MANYLHQGLQERKDKIQDAVNYLNQTKELFQMFGQQELTHVINKFDDIHNTKRNRKIELIKQKCNVLDANVERIEQILDLSIDSFEVKMTLATAIKLHKLNKCNKVLNNDFLLAEL